jgi:guanylate kinase
MTAAGAKPSGSVVIRRRGLMLVLSSPSGAGKTTISRRILGIEPDLVLSISATTRPMRPTEQDGVDYHFVDHATFDRMVSEGAFLEHAKVFDHQYGTPRAPVEQSLAAGQDVLFDIDWQGTQQLGDSSPKDLVSVFILPPSIAALEQRLKTRAQDSADVVARRMAKAADEMSHWAEYDYIIVNDDLETSIQRVRAILLAERLKRHRQVGLAEFVNGLREGA